MRLFPRRRDYDLTVSSGSDVAYDSPSGFTSVVWRLAQVCKLPLRIWLLSASGRDLVRQVSRAIGTPFLRKVLYVRSGVAVVRNRRILPCGSRALLRAPYLVFTPRWFGGLTMVCKLPLILWLIRASGRQCLRQFSRSFGTFFSRRSPFCSLERGGCSQPSHSSLRISSAFERSHLYFTPGGVGDFLWSASYP